MTPREQAEIDVAVIAADLQAAKERLREAVKAEVRAMPAMPAVAGFRDAVEAMAVVMGVPTELIDNVDHYAAWESAPKQWVALAQWHDGLRIEACAPGATKRGEWRLSEMPLDAAVKAALCWFADRDVFLPARAP